MTDDEWVQYAKKHKKEVLNDIIGNNQKEEQRRAIVLAGGPASGKSELREKLLEVEDNMCVVDTDEFRKIFPNYNGSNAEVYQRASSYLTDFCFNRLVDKKYSITLDTTFASRKAIQNVTRLLDHGYIVDLYYIYQNPIVSWHYAQKRDRIVPVEVFKRTTEKAFENVKVAYSEFKNNPNFTLILHNQEIKNGQICEDERQFDLISNTLKVNWSDIYADGNKKNNEKIR